MIVQFLMGISILVAASRQRSVVNKMLTAPEASLTLSLAGLSLATALCPSLVSSGQFRKLLATFLSELSGDV